MKKRELVFGSHNLHKVKEVRAKLANIPEIILKSLPDFGQVPEVVEDRPTIEGNSQKKAQEFAIQLDRLVLADDSGLEVDALNGAPGVYSARYAGEDGNFEANIQKLLKEMKNVPEEKRTARFVCVMTLATPEKILFSVRGTLEGKIAFDLKGTHGFGYDPVFIVLNRNQRLAELPLEEKNKISHRAQALELFLQRWDDSF